MRMVTEPLSLDARGEVAPDRTGRQVRQRARLMISRAVLTVLLVTTPVAGALVAVAYAPPARVEIAGQDISVKPVLGQNTTRLVDGALVRPEHAHVDVVDMDIGVDISTNWNNLLPSDKQTRRYLTALWEDPTPQIDRLRDAARKHVQLWSLIGSLTAFLTVGLVWAGLEIRRRRIRSYDPALAAIVSAHNRRLRIGLATLGLGLVVALDTLAVHIYRNVDQHTVTGSSLFVGTSLEGTEANGLVAEVLPFLSILQPRTTFYDDVSDNLESALAARPELVRTDEEVVFVLAEDFEDVNGMARQVGNAARLVDATFIALSGDLTFAGRPIETYIIDTVDYYAENRPVHLAPGLHDTPAVITAAVARDWQLPEGTTQDVDGLRLLSFADPRVSTVGTFGTDDLLRDPEVSVAAFVDQAIEQTCEEQPDFVLLHDHRLGRQIAASGCVEHAVLDGRSYTFLGPQQVPTTTGGSATELTSGSAGGHRDTRPDPGAIKNSATFTILTFDPATGSTTYALITVDPDGSVLVAPELMLPSPVTR
jgi:hypothetical protein